MTPRKFGVEIECGFERSLQANQVKRELEQNGLHDWDCVYDGTYIETRTPPLSGKEGFDTLKKGMELLVELEGYVTEEDGLHVHHDAPEFVNDFDAILKLVRSWYENQPVINEMVDQSRVGYDEICPPWTREQINYLEDRRSLGGHSRHALNITSLARHGTIEIRQHEGTLDYDEAEAWILFGQTFIENVVASHEPTPNLGSTDELLKHIRLAEKSGAFLRAKAARREQKFYRDDDDDGW